jgi:hypothetical protein
MAQQIFMNLKLKRYEVFDGGEDLHIFMFGMRVMVCFTETFVL